jgi:hypothetical protein
MRFAFPRFWGWNPKYKGGNVKGWIKFAYSYGLNRIKKKIWITLLEGRFELIFFHEDIVHSRNRRKRRIITTNKISNIGGKKKKNSNMKIFWILSFDFVLELLHVNFVLSNEEQYEICYILRIIVYVKQ